MQVSDSISRTMWVNVTLDQSEVAVLRAQTEAIGVKVEGSATPDGGMVVSVSHDLARRVPIFHALVKRLDRADRMVAAILPFA